MNYGKYGYECFPLTHLSTFLTRKNCQYVKITTVQKSNISLKCQGLFETIWPCYGSLDAYGGHRVKNKSVLVIKIYAAASLLRSLSVLQQMNSELNYWLNSFQGGRLVCGWTLGVGCLSNCKEPITKQVISEKRIVAVPLFTSERLVACSWMPVAPKSTWTTFQAELNIFGPIDLYWNTWKWLIQVYFQAYPRHFLVYYNWSSLLVLSG